MKNQELKIAVLIDADNASSHSIELSLEQISKHGEIVIKRIYGDFSNHHLFNWKEKVNKCSIKAMQSFAYTKGKNSTDISLIIDAMDILYSQKVNAFCIVSSDCDFTGLIHRIKENGLYTIGLGKNESCAAFKDACDIFIIEPKQMKVIYENETKSKTNSFINLSNNNQNNSNKHLPGLRIIGKMDVTCYAKKKFGK